MNKVKETIHCVIEDYTTQDNFESIPPENLQFSIDDDLFLDMLLMKIREVTIPYCSKLKESRESEMNTLIDQIDFVKNLYDESKNLVLCDILDDLNNNLEKYRRYQMDGLIIRTKANWIENGEKPSKYFCSLEKRNFVNKNIVKVVNDKNESVTNQEEILNEIKLFYQVLYQNNDDKLEEVSLSTLLNENTVPKLSDEQKQFLETHISSSEVHKSLKNLKNNKSPGTTGFPADFFKFFWNDIGAFLVRSFNCSIRKGELSTSQKLGIVSILPKGNKPREFLKNWRPISLLNTTYKIFSGIIANRLKEVLDTLIHENQKGFLSGRFIGENTRLMYDIISQTEVQDKPGMVLLLDFEKAFDSVSWNYIIKVLQFFNFGEYFIHLVKIIFTNIKLCVIQHGIFSEFFSIGRGCRQGDPASPYIFLLCVEIMGLMIRENRNITGIYLFDTEYKLIQYADDTTIILDGSEKSLKAALSLVNQFSKFSGLKPNYNKTCCVKIGSIRSAELNFVNRYDIQWSQDPFTFLGITFTDNLAGMIDLNYADKINSIRKMISAWSKRNISTIGRITVVKTLLLPKLIHLFMSLPTPGDNILKEINTLFFNYIWNSKVDRVARKCITKDYSDGGLKMINLQFFCKSLKITWIRRLENSNSAWAILLKSSLPYWFSSYHLLGNEFLYRLQEHLNIFWRQVFSDLCDFRQICRENILLTPIWCNKQIVIGNKDIFIERWFKKGMTFIDDFLDEDNHILSLENLNLKFNIAMPFVTYLSIVRQIRLIIGRENLDRLCRPIIPQYLNIIMADLKGCRNIYKCFNACPNDKFKHECKWENVLNLNVDRKWWQKHYNIPFTVTNDTKLQWLQFRIIHRIIATNSYLFNIKYVESDVCTFCHYEKETITHLFWDCIYINPLWGEFAAWYNDKQSENIVLDIVDVLFGKSNACATLNMLIILMKSFIYKQCVNKSTVGINGFISYLKYYQTIEKYIYLKKNMIQKFDSVWNNCKLV